ncbi:MAG: DUF4837 family protein [Candidatus Cryptobacteroides sp.]|nr:DUF4837 family protein [Bacteroidales bacterium]
MKTISRISAFIALFVAAVSCSSGKQKALLPNVSGKAGEVIIAMDKDNWEGDLGNEVRYVLGGDTPYLAQKEPLFNLVNVSPTGFADLFRVHRNIVIFSTDSSLQEGKVVYRADLWARPQCVIEVSAPDSQTLLNLFRENSDNISGALEQAERDRIIANAKLYEEYGIAEAVRGKISGSPHFPSGYKLRKMTDDFIWIADDKQYSTQGVFIYWYPAEEKENFSKENILAHRNAFMKANVPGMFDNTWMTTSTFIEPTVEFISFRGRQFAQTRGFWEVQNDFMGGPFVSHSFYSRDGKDIIVVEAWVYAPKYDKRQLLRQVESVIYSFEWAE